MNPSYNSGQMPQAPVVSSGAGMQAPISSGSGDVVLPSDAGAEKKSHKGIIILVVFLVLALVLGGIYALWQSGAFRNMGLGGELSLSVEERYNTFANYVLFGEDSTKELKLNITAEMIIPYFEGLSGEALQTYLAGANEKFVSFEEGYNKREAEDKVDLTPVKVYFMEYAGAQPLTVEEIIAMYTERNGQVTAKTKINERFTTTNTDQQFGRYVGYSKTLAETYLDVVEKADRAKCILEGELLPGCYEVSEEDQKTIETKSREIDVAVEAMRKSAMGVMVKLDQEMNGNTSEGANA